MNKFKNWALICLSVLSVFWFSSGYASFLSITPTNPFPQEVVMGTQAVGEYMVQNQTASALTFTDNSAFSHSVGRLGGPGYCTAHTTLAPNSQEGSSCLLAYTYTPSAGETTYDGQIKLHVDGTAVTIVGPSVALKVVPQPAPGLPVLMLNKSNIEVPVGGTGDVTVTNTSPSVAANDVRFYLPTALANQLDSYTDCPVIPAGGNCTMYLTAKTTATPSVPPHYPITVQGSNTYPVSATVIIGQQPNFVATPLSINAPGDVNLELTNNGGAAGSVTAVSVGSGLHNVSYVSNTCSAIAPSGTCHIVLNATNQAYGSGVVNITYNDGATGPDAHTTGNVTVANTAITYTDEVDGDLIVPPGTSGSPVTTTFHVQNTGNFAWQNPLVDWKTSAIPNVVLQNSTCTGAINPSASCTFDLVSSGATVGDNALITGTGANISPTDVNALVSAPPGTVAIMPDTDQKHLYYRAIKITNTSDVTGTISAINISHTLDPYVKVCPSSGAASDDCVYKSNTDCEVGGELSPAESCLIWLKAQKDESLGLGQQPKGTVTVDATINWGPGVSTNVSKTFDLTYGQYLYAGGNFAIATNSDVSIAVNGIAKWDGSNWSFLNTGTSTIGMNSSVYALHSAFGDLFAGGAFNNAGGASVSFIAKWNGDAWSAVGGGFDSDVYALTGVEQSSSNDEALYAGGTFTTAYPGPVSVYNYRVAKWNGSNWSSLGTGSTPASTDIYALTTDGANIYAGGASSGAKVAKYDGTSWVTPDMSSFPAVSGDAFRALVSYGDQVYAGGYVSPWPGEELYHTVYRWDGASGGSIASIRDQAWPDTGGVWALTSYNPPFGRDELIAGGAYWGEVDDIIARSQEWGLSWERFDSPLDSDTGRSVRALTVFNNILYAGGDLDGGLIKSWNSEDWLPLREGLAVNFVDPEVTPAAVFALTVAPSLDIEEQPAP